MCISEQKYKCINCEVKILNLKCGSSRKKFRHLAARSKRMVITAEFELKMVPAKQTGKYTAERRIDILIICSHYHIHPNVKWKQIIMTMIDDEIETFHVGVVWGTTLWPLITVIQKHTTTKLNIDLPRCDWVVSADI